MLLFFLFREALLSLSRSLAAAPQLAVEMRCFPFECPQAHTVMGRERRKESDVITASEDEVPAAADDRKECALPLSLALPDEGMG